MSGPIIELLTIATIMGSGIVGGVFFAFSTFVMSALTRLPAAEGIRAMQQINITVLNLWFLGAFVGTAATSVLLAGVSFLGRRIRAAVSEVGRSIFTHATAPLASAYTMRPRIEPHESRLYARSVFSGLDLRPSVPLGASA